MFKVSTPETRNAARDRAERVGQLQAGTVSRVVCVGGMAANGVVRAAETRLGVWVTAGLLVAAGSVSDVRL